MISYSRRTLLKASAAFAGASTIGFPSVVRGQTEKIKIGHLTPLTGFLGALGAYAQLGIRLAEEEINHAGGVMGRQLDITSEDSVNPATAATKAQRMLDQDGVTVLMGEINSASALTIMQVADRNKRLFMQIGARSDALRGKNCNRYTFHVDIPSTVMVNAVGKALVRDNMMKDKKFYTWRIFLAADAGTGGARLHRRVSLERRHGGRRWPRRSEAWPDRTVQPRQCARLLHRGCADRAWRPLCAAPAGALAVRPRAGGDPREPVAGDVPGLSGRALQARGVRDLGRGHRPRRRAARIPDLPGLGRSGIGAVFRRTAGNGGDRRHA